MWVPFSFFLFFFSFFSPVIIRCICTLSFAVMLFMVHFSFCGEDVGRFGSIPAAAHSVFPVSSGSKYCLLWLC